MPTIIIRPAEGSNEDRAHLLAVIQPEQAHMDAWIWWAMLMSGAVIGRNLIRATLMCVITPANIIS